MKTSSNSPSSAYVFVVVSLAAFLVIFTVSLRPATQYTTQVQIRLDLNEETADTRLAELRATLLSPEIVLKALRNANMVQGDATPETVAIAAEIASRMRVDASPTNDDRGHAKLSLVTKHPSVGVQLLDQMIEGLKNGHESDVLSSTPAPATAERIRGSDVAPSSLLLVIMCSGLVGLGGLVWLENTKLTPVLLTKEDVATTMQLPVVVDFTRDKAFPRREKHQRRRRRFQAVLCFAEVTIAAAVVLVLFNLATVQAFSELLTQDPLAAYSEAVGRILS